MELKSLLKDVKKLLASGENEKALELLEDPLESGEQDYMLLCFAALANFNTDDKDEAVKLYEKAIQQDRAAPTAWQGLYKVFSSGDVKISEKAIETVEVLIPLSEGEKKSALQASRREWMLQLKQYARLSQDDLKADLAIPRKIIDNNIGLDKLPPTEELQAVIARCFSALTPFDEKTARANFMLLYQTASSFPVWSKALFDSSLSACEDAWIKQKRLEAAATLFMESGEVPEEWDDALALPEETADDDPVIVRLLAAVVDDDWMGAGQVVDCLPYASLASSSFPPLPVPSTVPAAATPVVGLVLVSNEKKEKAAWPPSDEVAARRSIGYLAVRVLIRDEAFERAASLANALRRSTPPSESSIVDALHGLEAEALLRGRKTAEAAVLLPLARPAWSLVEARIHVESGRDCQPDLMKTLSREDAARVDAHRLLKEGRKEEALAAMEGIEEERWEDVLMRAECSPPAAALPLLLKVARLNGRCSRALFLLASLLREKSPGKASGLALKAASIRPDCEEYVRLADELLGGHSPDDSEAAEERLSMMQRYTEATSLLPSWASVSIARQLLAVGKATPAITHLQRALRTEETALVWALLGEAYSSRGQLQSAVGAYGRSIELDPNPAWAIMMAQILLRLRELDRVEELCAEWKERIEEGEKKEEHANYLAALTVLQGQAQLGKAEADLAALPPLIATLSTLLSTDKNIMAMTWKLAGDALLLLAKASPAIYTACSEMPKEWTAVTGAEGALKTAISMYSNAVSMRRDDPSLWYDLSLALLLSASIGSTTDPSTQRKPLTEDAKKSLEKSRTCLIHALKMSDERKGPWKGRLWTLLAKIEDACGTAVQRVHHAYAQALEYDNRNDDAWLHLGILYYRHGEKGLASECIEKATKWAPRNARAWALWAQLAAEHNEASQAEDMFRHSLSIQPTPWAACRYADVLVARLSIAERRGTTGSGVFDPSRSHVDMEGVLKLRDLHDVASSPAVLSRLAVLAELFGYYGEAAEIHDVIGVDTIARERVQLRRGIFEGPSSRHSQLANLRVIAGESTKRLRERVEAKGIVLDPSIEEAPAEGEKPKNVGVEKTEVRYEDEEEGAVDEEEEGSPSPPLPDQPVVVEAKKYAALSLGERTNIPLLVSAILTFEMPMADAFTGALHDILPRHELVDYFPTRVPEELDNGIRYVEPDGEEPFRFRHRVAARLVEKLKEARAVVDEEKAASAREEIPVL